MAQHQDINSFVYTTIEEYIDAAGICLNTVKNKVPDDCFGMAALVLLTSAIDAMGTYFRKKQGQYDLLPAKCTNWKSELGDVKQHYVNIYYEYFDKTGAFADESEFVDILYREYRCHAVHNGMITETHTLQKVVSKKPQVVEKKCGGTYVYVDRLFNVVKDVFETFKKDHPLSTTTLTVPYQSGSISAVTKTTKTQGYK